MQGGAEAVAPQQLKADDLLGQERSLLWARRKVSLSSRPGDTVDRRQDRQHAVIKSEEADLKSIVRRGVFV